MKVVLFCGGTGLRLDRPDMVPKPMVEIGGRPLLWHVMSHYGHFDHREFVLCLGLRGELVEDYFRSVQAEEGWSIDFVRTGLEASIGERLLAVRERVASNEIFLAGRGDTLSDVPLPAFIQHHADMGKVASLLAVRPNDTFDVVTAMGSRVVAFQDVAQKEIRTDGGSYVLRGDVFDYLEEGDDLPELFDRLIEAGQLVAYAYDGAWATLDDMERLDALVGAAPIRPD